MPRIQDEQKELHTVSMTSLQRKSSGIEQVVRQILQKVDASDSGRSRSALLMFDLGAFDSEQI